MEELDFFLEEAVKANPQVSSLLLRRKISRILRTLESLKDKKVSLDLEIKRQRRALVLKRNELKRTRTSSRTSTSTAAKVSVKLEDVQYQDQLIQLGPQNTQKLDSMLLEESAKLLESFD